MLRLAVPLLIACTPPAPEPLATIDIGGGVVGAGSLEVSFPPGAVFEPVAITVEVVDDPLPGSPGPVFDLGPSGTVFANRPYVTIDLPPEACEGGRRYLLATVEDGAWTPIADSWTEASPCRVTGRVAHFSHFGPWEARAPLDQPVQNNILEGMLGGVYAVDPGWAFREHRGDGLTTVGLSRPDSDLRVCAWIADSTVRAAVETEIAVAVGVLSDGTLATTTAGCVDPGVTCPFSCTALAPGAADQVNVYVGCGFMGIPCFGPDERLRGGDIVGGILLLASATGSRTDLETLRHELGHVYGLWHTWGEPGVMSYRVQTSDYAPHERDAFAVAMQLPPGSGLRDLLALGVLQDDPAVLREPPTIERTERAVPPRDRTFAPADRDHAAPGEQILVVGQRLTLPLMTETLTPARPLGYAPPVVRFGAVATVPDLGRSFQATPFDWVGSPTGILRLNVPIGAGTPLVVERYDGTTATHAAFTVDPVPPPPGTPREVAGLTCPRAGSTVLSWSLPVERLDGTPFDPSGATAVVYRNGVALARLSPAPASYEDLAVHPAYEAHLYQVVLEDGGLPGVPSAVCRAEPDQSGTEVAMLLVDRGKAMRTLRPDGTTRFENVVGPLPAPAVPRAWAALDELFAPDRPAPVVFVMSFARGEPLRNEVRALYGTDWTSSPTEAAEALAAIAPPGPNELGAPLAEAMCGGADALVAFVSPGDRATLRVFTAGDEDGAIEPVSCPASCALVDGRVPWGVECRPGTRPGVAWVTPPSGCTTCQLDLVADAWAAPVVYFPEYFGPEGPNSPLPAGAGFLYDLAVETGGRFVHNADDGTQSLGTFVSDAAPIAWPGDDRDVAVECPDDRATVLLSGMAIDDIAGSPLGFRWFGPFDEGPEVQGPDVPVTLPVGAHQVLLVVSDAHQRSLPAPLVIRVEALDGPPEVEIAATPSVLWPPNGALVPVEVALDAEDDCHDGLEVTLVEVTSSEPEASPGPRDADIVGADPGTDDRQVWLRAERDPDGEGRTYTLVYEVTDAAGYAAEASVTVEVPRHHP